MKQPFRNSIFILLLTLAFSSTSVELSIGRSGIFSLPFKYDFDINEYLSIKHINRIYNTKHPHFENLQTSNTRSFNRYGSHLTGITEVSIIKYKKNNLRLNVGKDYIDVDDNLLFSTNSFSLNHIMFQFSKKKLDYHYYIISLNNKNLNSDKFMRWLYYRKLSFKINHRLSVNLSEAMISTGINRGIDWYYLTPGALFLGEAENNLSDGSSQMSNSFFGMGANYILNSDYSLRANIIIDDFQKSSSGRDMYEDVFGFLLGVDYKKGNFYFSIEYQYASPWLYTNMNSFAHYEHHNQPIGLRYPNSHALEFNLEYGFKNALITSSLFFGKKGEQDIFTQWKSENNNIDNFDFTQTLKPELYFKYDFLSDNIFVPNLILFHNWKESDRTDLILEWSFLIKGKKKE